MAEEEGGEQIARPLGRARQPGNGDHPRLRRRHGEGLDGFRGFRGFRGRAGRRQGGRHDQARPAPQQDLGGGQRPFRGVGGAPGQVFELEGVGEQYIGAADGLGLDKLGHAGGHVDTLGGVADDRIAAIEGVAVGGLDGGHGVENHGSRLGGAEVAAEHRPAAGQRAAPGDALDERRHLRRRHDAAPPVAVSRVVGVGDRIDRPHLEAEALQGEHRGGVADVTVGHRRLDGEDGHGLAAPFPFARPLTLPQAASGL